jgi:hypothetical protein
MCVRDNDYEDGNFYTCNLVKFKIDVLKKNVTCTHHVILKKIRKEARVDRKKLK